MINPPSAVIVGAGLAGLVAADALAARGWDVTVVEARDRVGGRTWTDHAANGALVERGAEWVEDEHDSLRDLCERLDLHLVRAGMSYHDRPPIGGDPVGEADLLRGRHIVRGAFEDLGDRRTSASVAEVLDALPLEPAVRTALRARIECTSGAGATDLAAHHLFMLAHAPDESDALRILEGSDAPARALANTLGDRLRLRCPVHEITVGDEGVSVRTDGGDVEAAFCVVALPAAVLQGLPLDAPLPIGARAALHSLGAAWAAKLFVPLTGPVEPGAMLDVTRDFWTWTARRGESTCAPILAGFAGSPAMLDALRVDEGAITWANRVAELRPDLPLDLAHAEVQTWHDDPWARSVYTTTPVGTDPDLEPFRHVHGRLAVAGEWTDDLWAGYMEGAIRSGERAANALVAAQTP